MVAVFSLESEPVVENGFHCAKEADSSKDSVCVFTRHAAHQRIGKNVANAGTGSVSDFVVETAGAYTFF